MKIIRPTQAYNERRYGKPWIATVKFDAPRGEFEFGTWIGDRGPGTRGILEIDANTGDIIAMGQRDHRGKGTSCDYYTVNDDGSLNKLSGKLAALDHYRNTQTQPA